MTSATPQQRTILGACIALLFFSVATTIMLWAWFARAESPWTWRSFVATVSALGGFGACGALWYAPSRAIVYAGIGTMAFSLLRVGAPESWTATTYALLAATLALVVPLVHAAISLPPSRR